MMGMMFLIYAIPVLSLAFVVWAVASRRLSDGPRRATMAATILLACGVWSLLRTNGITGDAASDFAWRWAETAEQRLLAHASGEPTAPAPPPAAARTGADWPGFRGPHRDGVIPGVRIETDWLRSRPVELWRRPVGPGWSSIAVRGGLLYTQEQRGGDEVVACYNLTTGEPVWRHRDAARFWESNAGAGPRAARTAIYYEVIRELTAHGPLVASRLADPPQTDLRLLAHSAVGHQPPQQPARSLRLPRAQVKCERLQDGGVVRTDQALGLIGDSAIQQPRDLGMRFPVILRLHEIERLERSSGE
jgi:hypothetical protein